MLNVSEVVERGAVRFPEFNKERHYMIPFFQSDGLPEELSHWQMTVDDMLDGYETDSPIYFMVDQSFVEAGSTQRRPGVHVDGYWNPGICAHNGVGGHVTEPTHGPRKPYTHVPTPRHFSGASSWEVADFSHPEALLLASNVKGCRSYLGEYNGPLKDGGDASLVDLSGLKTLDMDADKCYAGTVGTLHESLPLEETAFRTLVRLNCPNLSIH